MLRGSPGEPRPGWRGLRLCAAEKLEFRSFYAGANSCVDSGGRALVRGGAASLALVWPMRWQRAMACRSFCGSQEGRVDPGDARARCPGMLLPAAVISRRGRGLTDVLTITATTRSTAHLGVPVRVVNDGCVGSRKRDALLGGDKRAAAGHRGGCALAAGTGLRVPWLGLTC
jgi:hypothetical protein